MPKEIINSIVCDNKHLSLIFRRGFGFVSVIGLSLFPYPAHKIRAVFIFIIFNIFYSQSIYLKINLIGLYEY